MNKLSRAILEYCDDGEQTGSREIFEQADILKKLEKYKQIKGLTPDATEPLMSDVIDDRLKMLMDYTKFHIGVYISVAGVVIAAIKTGQANVNVHFMVFAVLSFLLAGICGGLIASNIIDARSYANYLQQSFGGIKVSKLIDLEHYSFWVGVIFILYGVAWPHLYGSELWSKFVVPLNLIGLEFLFMLATIVIIGVVRSQFNKTKG